MECKDISGAACAWWGIRREMGLGGSMTFEAKTLVPLPGDPDAANGAFEDAADGGVTLLEAPAGYVLTEGLALAFTRSDRHPALAAPGTGRSRSGHLSPFARRRGPAFSRTMRGRPRSS